MNNLGKVDLSNAKVGDKVFNILTMGNKNILKRRPDLEINGDFSPEGIKYHLNEVFVEELKVVLYGRS